MYVAKSLLFWLSLAWAAFQGISAFDQQSWFESYDELTAGENTDESLSRVQTESTGTLFDIIASDGRFSILAKIVSEDDVLKGAISDTRANVMMDTENHDKSL